LAAAILLLTVGEVDVLASIASFTTMTVFVAVNFALIRLRRIEPHANRTFRVPFVIGYVPLPAVIGIAVCVIFLFQFKSVVYLTGLSALAASALIYLLFNRFKKVQP
jgi:APA family basic amino acid/polyamine antiporter